MKKNQFLEICQEYDELLKTEGYEIKLKEPFVCAEFANEDLCHIRWMLNEIPKMINDPCKLEKSNRWIGFIQGVMWMKGYYSIEDMKGHTRSHEENQEDEKYDQIKNEQYYYLFEGGVSDINY